MRPGFADAFEALGALAVAGAQVSARVDDVQTGATLLAVDDTVSLPTASVGKVLLLIEVAAGLGDSEVGGLSIVDRVPDDRVGGSSLWQFLQAPSLPVADLAALVGAMSDNEATNALARRIGLESVRERTDSLGLIRTALLDTARDFRGLDDAPQLSIGSTAELSQLMRSISLGTAVDEATSTRVAGWLSLNVDLSMVAAAFGLNPLAHTEPDHGMLLFNKTGTDVGIRSDTGVLTCNESAVSYAVTVVFDDTDLKARLDVLEAMRAVGSGILAHLHDADERARA